MNPADKYNIEIDKLFDQLERKRHKPREIVSNKKKQNLGLTFVVMSAGMGAVVGAGAMAGAMLNDGNSFALLPVLMAGALGATAGGFGGLMAFESAKFNPAHFLGKATVLDEGKTREVTQWAEKHPRIIPLLGRWAANNPQGQINSADYNALKKSMDKIEDLSEVREQLVNNESNFSAVGISQAANRTRLGKIAGVAGKVAKSGQPKI